MATKIRNEQLEISDGWVNAQETWTYSSVDGPTGVITVPTDATTKYSVGMRVKFTQTTVKYGIITAITATIMTIYMGTDYILENATISANFYSTQKAPFGFPLNPTKWTVEFTDVVQVSKTAPVQNQWYNLGSYSISIPIGVWDVLWSASFGCYKGASTSIQTECTLSTTNNSVSDEDFTSNNRMESSTGTLSLYVSQRKEKNISLTSKTSYYLNCRTIIASIGAIIITVGDKTIIRAVCSYL